VLGYEVPRWSVAALVAQGDAWVAAADAVDAAPVPSEVGAEEEAVAGWTAAIQEQYVVPLEAEATAIYGKALELAKTHGIEDSSSARAVQALEKLTP
jgi:hypothetical protein